MCQFKFLQWVSLRWVSLRWVRCVGLWLCLWLAWTSTAQASIHRYPEGDGQVMYRSLQTLRDQGDRAWQTVLFKRVNHGQVTTLHLRLVGFPGGTELLHPRSLHVATTGASSQWDAPDVFAIASLDPDLASSVGEYDFRDVMAQLETNLPLSLTLPLQAGESLTLTVPPFAVREWRKLGDR